MADSKTKQIVPPFNRDDIKNLAEEASQDPNSSFGYEVINLNIHDIMEHAGVVSGDSIPSSDWLDEYKDDLYKLTKFLHTNHPTKPILLKGLDVEEDSICVVLYKISRHTQRIVGADGDYALEIASDDEESITFINYRA